jgi:hypothetical protein
MQVHRASKKTETEILHRLNVEGSQLPELDCTWENVDKQLISSDSIIYAIGIADALITSGVECAELDREQYLFKNMSTVRLALGIEVIRRIWGHEISAKIAKAKSDSSNSAPMTKPRGENASAKSVSGSSVNVAMSQ